MDHSILSKPIRINEPMVIIPVEEYQLLLKEAGRSPTPKLDREISEARNRFKKGKTISWKSIRNGD
ncbi:MAG: hypothetical protein L6416_05130 [Candidatus Omnitrophica bacterium]|nr:hypothetical protein [Candidatus Omnitrophota bacterium]